jgi:hypothetical protein
MDSPRPFDPDRYSPVRVSTLMRLPESNARSFMIASALGNILDGDGTRNSLKSAKDATGVVISEKRRDVILEQLGIGLRRWRRLVHDWELRYLAHRCSPGVVVLFTKPFLQECPACHVEISGTGETPSPIRPKPRGRPFARHTPTSTADVPLVVPRSDANSTARAARIVPSSGTNAPHPNRGVAMRDEEGMEEEVAVQRPSEVLEEGSVGNRRVRESEVWPIPEGGYISAWDIGGGEQ